MNVLAAPYILMLVIIWIYMHFKYFYPLLQNLSQSGADSSRAVHPSGPQGGQLLEDITQRMSSSEKARRDDKAQLSQLQTIQNQSQIFSKKKPASVRGQLENYLIIFSSCVYGSSLISLTTLSILYVSHSLSLGEMKNFLKPKAFYLSVFFIGSVPLFILIGTALVLSKVKEKTKFILIPMLGALIPMCFSMPLSLVIEEFKDIRPLRKFFMLGPSCTTLYWITLIWIKINHQKVSMIINSYTCLFFIIPIFYLLPLRNESSYDDSDPVAYYFQYILIFTGVSLLILLIMADLVITYIKTWYNHLNRHKYQGKQAEEIEDEFTRSERFELSNVFKYDLANFGLWGNSFGYILTMTILMFMYYSQPEWIKPHQAGSLTGLQIVIVFLFFYSLIILLLRSTHCPPRQPRFNRPPATL